MPTIIKRLSETEARKRVCPKCHAEAGKPCRRMNPSRTTRSTWHPMKGIHAERRDLVSRARTNEQDSTS